jgi:hypothetical protein
MGSNDNGVVLMSDERDVLIWYGVLLPKQDNWKDDIICVSLNGRDFVSFNGQPRDVSELTQIQTRAIRVVI